VSPAGDRLSGYRAKRDRKVTPEPPGEHAAGDAGARFVLQEHHATRLHWDLRLERDGVAVSFAVPHGLPPEPGSNHLAIRTEDHPLGYLGFEGEIPAGSYGAGTMRIADHGTYETLKWEPRKIEVLLHGEHHRARYALFVIDKDRDADPARDGAQWMVHRMDPPDDPDATAMPDRLAPMLARAGTLPHGDAWTFEVKWDGVRVLAFSAPGSLCLRSRNGNDITARYPELARPLGFALGAHRAILDGEVVALDEDGKPSFSLLQRRMHVVSEAKVKRLAKEHPVRFVVFDVLWLDGHPLMGLPYEQRRERLRELDLTRDELLVPEPEDDGAALLEAARGLGLEGVVAKRRDAAYVPGARSDAWIKVKLTGQDEFVIGGWTAGEGRRRDHIGALLVGLPDPETGVLHFAGRVGTGFSDRDLEGLRSALAKRRRDTSPFAPSAGGVKPPRGAAFVEPELRCEVEFTAWTPDGVLRHPSFKGLVMGEEPAPVRTGSGGATVVNAAGRELRLTNLGKPLWPDGTTKGDLIAYYARIADVLVPHLSGKPLTLRRWPDGVQGPTFFEKRAPSHRPDWVATTPVRRSDGSEEQIVVEEPATLAWLGNLAAIELHTPLHRCNRAHDGHAEILAFDLDPGPPAGFVECARVAQLLRGMLAGLGLETFVKSSGSKGLQVYVPLNGDGVPYAQTRAFAKAVAEVLERAEPDLVVSRQAKTMRTGKVLVDWMQNDDAKTTVSVYSVRAAHDRPTVSAPLTWDELDTAADAGDADAFLLVPDDVLARVAAHGDSFASVLTLVQDLPATG